MIHFTLDTINITRNLLVTITEGGELITINSDLEYMYMYYTRTIHVQSCFNIQ